MLLPSTRFFLANQIFYFLLVWLFGTYKTLQEALVLISMLQYQKRHISIYLYH